MKEYRINFTDRELERINKLAEAYGFLPSEKKFESIAEAVISYALIKEEIHVDKYRYAKQVEREV